MEEKETISGEVEGGYNIYVRRMKMLQKIFKWTPGMHS